VIWAENRIPVAGFKKDVGVGLAAGGVLGLVFVAGRHNDSDPTPKDDIDTGRDNKNLPD
jgi:hypothetical protein